MNAKVSHTERGGTDIGKIIQDQLKTMTIKIFFIQAFNRTG